MRSPSRGQSKRQASHHFKALPMRSTHAAFARRGAASGTRRLSGGCLNEIDRCAKGGRSPRARDEGSPTLAPMLGDDAPAISLPPGAGINPQALLKRIGSSERLELMSVRNRPRKPADDCRMSECEMPKRFVASTHEPSLQHGKSEPRARDPMPGAVETSAPPGGAPASIPRALLKRIKSSERPELS